MKRLAFLTLISMTGCAGLSQGWFSETDNYVTEENPEPKKPSIQERLDSWVGSKKTDIISKFGIPDRKYKDGELEIIEYDKKEYYGFNSFLPLAYIFTIINNEVVRASYTLK